MKKLKRKHIVAAAVLIFSVACAELGAVYAASDADGKFDPMSNLAAAIASKFNLNQSDVQAVFDGQKSEMETRRREQMAQMQASRQQEFADRLAQAVSAGKLTQAQADAVKTKHAELQAQCEAQRTAAGDKKNMTKAERQAAMEAQRTKMEAGRAELKQWAADNGIPEEYIPAGFMGGGGGRGGRGFGGHAPN